MAVSAMEHHFWFGQWVAEGELENKLNTLGDRLARTLTQAFPLEALLEAAQQVSDDLCSQGRLHQRLVAAQLAEAGQPARDDLLHTLGAAFQRDSLLKRMYAELGLARPGDIERRYPSRAYEGWLPQGCLVHVAQGSSALGAAFRLVEGLLTGNVNVMVHGAHDGAFARALAEALCEADSGGMLRDYIAVLSLSRDASPWLQKLVSHADVVSVGGGAEYIDTIRDMTPKGVPLIVREEKLLLGYVSADVLSDAAARLNAWRAFATDICRPSQPAGASPQILYLECEDAQLRGHTEELAAQLSQFSAIPSLSALGHGEIAVHVAGGCIRLKAIKREQLVQTLRPMRTRIQTCGLACGLASLAPLTYALFAAGVTRITRPGEMGQSYPGAPSDGMYPLQRLMRRVSLDAPESASGIGALSQLGRSPSSPPRNTGILDKFGFQARAANTPEVPDLVFRSGGSSGNTVFSTFSWHDYHAQMAAAAHGLLAAGMEPEKDRVMNLFFAGHIYGSFISFWTILEMMGAKMVPMGMIHDYQEVADAIVHLKVNTLVGSANYVMGLFEQEGHRIRGVVEKVFYGGETLTRARRERLEGHFGVRLVRSVAYGANDVGPIGYQCMHCKGGEHHLYETVQQMELVGLEDDQPVGPGETGRILLTTSPLLRAYPRVERYEIGDIGRWVDTPCPCGRKDRLFDLLGRTGDIFKAGGPFFNARRFVDILDSQLNYSGPTQVHLLEDGPAVVMQLWIGEGHGVTEAEAARAIRLNYPEIDHSSEMLGNGFRFEVRAVPDSDFVRIATSGKLKPVCDHRCS